MKRISTICLNTLLFLSLFSMTLIIHEPFQTNNELPIADAGGPYQSFEGENVALNASNSYDPDGDALQYRWDFNDDGIWDTSWLDKPKTNHIWGDDYQGNVKLEVTDGIGFEQWHKEDGVRVSIDGTYTNPNLSFGPDVLELNDGTYRMYYTQLHSPISGSYYGNIVSAVSDDGLLWTKESGVRVDYGGPYDTYESFEPEVISLPNGTFRMYYTGAIKGHYQILSAFSFDSISWIKENGIRIPFDSTYASVEFPNIVILPSGEHRMYYQAVNVVKGCMEIMSALSDDGLQWTIEGVRLAPGGLYDSIGVHTPEVTILSSGTYRMFYTGNDGFQPKILSAISDDGLSWTKENKILIDIGGSYDSKRASSPDIVVFPDGTIRMYYTGFDGSYYRILSAIQINQYLTSSDSAPVKIGNLDPEVTILSSFIDLDISLRISGSKWSNVNLTLYEEDDLCGFLEIERWPGSPDNNPSIGSMPSRLNLTKLYKAIITYNPYPDSGDNIKGDQGNNGKDKKNNAGNPVWLILGLKDGSEIKVHHIFNTEQSKIRDSQHKNHIEPWEVQINPLLIGHQITIIAHAKDSGSDDLGFTWNFKSTTLWYNNDGSIGASSSDPYPSPEGVYPFVATDSVQYQYLGSCAIELKVEDDDKGEKIVAIDIV